METQHPLVSVIVSIYNVEKYVRKCLESLKHQTMKQIEVICIDDGSTDSSGKIADEYKSQGWPIFRVIHTENYGLSATRNRGIDEARSDWLMFVDGDDWVNPEFCRMPYEATLENDVDMVVFGAVDIKNGKTKKSRVFISPGIVDEMIVHEYGSVASWNKLYKYDLFKSIRFPNGRVYEDSATTHKLVHEAEQILYMEKELYYHVYRKDSISQSQKVEYERDAFISTLERCEDLVMYGYSKEKTNSEKCSAALGFLATNPSHKDSLYREAKRIVISEETIPKTFGKKKKIGMVICRLNEQLFYKYCKMLGKI